MQLKLPSKALKDLHAREGDEKYQGKRLVIDLQVKNAVLVSAYKNALKNFQVLCKDKEQ